MSRVLIPGSFDPITLGHLDIISRASKMFDEVIVLVSRNESKNYMLCTNKRVVLVEDAVKNLENITVCAYDGLLVDFAAQNNIDMTVTGIRNVQDYMYEQNMADTNMMLSRKMHGRDFETIYFPASKDYIDICSSVVRFILQNNGDVSGLVPNEKLLMSVICD